MEVAKFGTKKGRMQKIIETITNFFRDPWKSEVYDYLSQSVDLCDLETRIKALRHGDWL